MDELLSKIDDLLSNSRFTRDFFTEAQQLEKETRKEIEITKRSIESLESNAETKIAFDLSVEQALSSAPEILKEQIQIAVQENVEYAYTPFLIPLIDVANNPDLYKVIGHGTGWSRKVTIQIVMDEVAGNIDDYATAVEIAREEMGAKPDRDPAKASMIWRTRVWPSRGGLGPYQHVIGTRLANLSSEAPFWSLLNYGNKAVSMASDIGGTPYPSHGGTHFVEKTEERLLQLFTASFSRLREFNTIALDRLKNLIRQYLDAIDRLHEGIDDVTDDIENAEPLVQRLRTHELKDIDPVKLRKAREDYKAGRLKEHERINIGIRGTRVRVSPSTLARLD